MSKDQAPTQYIGTRICLHVVLSNVLFVAEIALATPPRSIEPVLQALRWQSCCSCTGSGHDGLRAGHRLPLPLSSGVLPLVAQRLRPRDSRNPLMDVLESTAMWMRSFSPPCSAAKNNLPRAEPGGQRSAIGIAHWRLPRRFQRGRRCAAWAEGCQTPRRFPQAIAVHLGIGPCAGVMASLTTSAWIHRPSRRRWMARAEM